MLYDTKKAGIYSTENFLAWLESQPRQKSYLYINPTNCAVTQYLQAHGVPIWDCILEVETIRALGWEDIVIARPQTFGAAAKRARYQLYGPWYVRLLKFFKIK